MRFIINDIVIFDSVKHTLQAYPHSSDAEIKLNQPASRCLSLLIQHNGVTVKQEFFIDEVWRKKGMVVTVNTFYQNISLLRKALKESGLLVSIVITVPKKGLMFSAKAMVYEDDDVAFDVVRHGVHEIPSQPENETSTKVVKLSVLKRVGGILNGLLLFGIVIFIIKEAYIIFYSKGPVSTSSGYEFFAMHKGCSIYTNNNAMIKKIEGLEKIEKYLECRNYDFVYVTFNSYSNQILVIMCQGKLYTSRKNKCYTKFIVKDEHEVL